MRHATPEDASTYVEWVLKTKSNDFDPGIAHYPNLDCLVCEDATGPILYAPVHPVLMVESVAVRPDITPRQYIESLLEMDRKTLSMAREYGMKEIWTSSSYEPMVRTLKRHLYDSPRGTVLRKKVL